MKIKFCVIGTNFISDKFVDAVSRVSGAEVVAVYSRTVESGERFASRHGIPKVYCDLSEMLADGEINSVYVASPTFLHKEHTVKCLTGGKHVLCEKSISTSYEEFLEMKWTAENCERVLLEAMRPAHDPALSAIISAMGEIGKVRRAHFEFCKYSSRYDSFKVGVVENAFNPEIKNSALSDIGVYPLWLAVRLFGEPKKVSSSSIRLSNGFDAMGSVVLDYGDTVATVEYSKITEGVSPSVIEGECGSIIIDKISEPKTVTLVTRGEGDRVVYSSACENNMIYEVEAFRDVVLGKKDGEAFTAVSEALMKTMDRVIDAQSNY